MDKTKLNNSTTESYQCDVHTTQCNTNGCFEKHWRVLDDVICTFDVWYLVKKIRVPIGTLMQNVKPISKIVLNSFSGLGSSRRHLQSGNSLSGSLHYGINSDDDILPIPQPPLPPTSVPPHLNHLIINCTEDDIDQDEEDEEEEEEIDMENEISSMNLHHHAVL